MPALQRRTTDTQNRRLEKIIDAAKTTDFSDHCPIPVEQFVELYYRNVSVEDLRDRSLDDLAGAALSHLRFASKRKPGIPKVRILNPNHEEHGWSSDNTILQMINDDMPFLVDSSGLALNRRGLGIRLTVHPIFHVVRDANYRITDIKPEPDKDTVPESWIQVEFSKETDAEDLEEIQAHVNKILDDVRAAVNDWRAMKQESADLRKELTNRQLPVSDKYLEEGLALLEWMEDDHFTFLGYREYKLVEDSTEETLVVIPHSGLGILRGGPLQSQAHHSNVLPKDIRKQIRSKELLLVTKANSLATVHRNSYLDYVGVKVFDDDGKVVGEKRFLGLFTSVAYSRSPRDIPLLRFKVQQVMEQSALQHHSHARKALLHILETYPRDELFQSNVEDLFRTAHGIFSLQERQRVKLFVRRDPYRRFFSCLVYVPRERYTTRARRRIQSILQEAFDGSAVESSPLLSESVLARLHVIVRTKSPKTGQYNIKSLEKKIADAVRSWQDGLLETLIERIGEKDGRVLFAEYGEVFPAAYEEDITPREATFDVERLASLGKEPTSLRMSLYRPPNYGEKQLRFKLFRREKTIPISEALPMLENMGLRVISERPYHVELRDGSLVWIQDFEMEYGAEQSIDPASVNEIFQHTFARTWLGETENDGFNRLVLGASLTFRQTALLRAYCKYLLQTGMPFSQQYIEAALNNNQNIARILVDFFENRFDPNVTKAKRTRSDNRALEQLTFELETVASQDDDRILRAFRDMILATLRTNYFQRELDGDVKPYISFKIDPSKAPDLPLPLPMFEIFVYSPRVEGVHLRGGPVARGGLRWSDRREDFRTEVLGLMKAQMVKNTVIVPVGAKGGFVVK
ncbi:MAG: NAD-glutamate dehydrogenase domain-containing protein, partial [Pseudomonadota bacterium]